MQELTLTRRSFVKATTLAGAALAMGTQVAGSLGKADKAWAAEPSDIKMYVSTCHGCIQACPCRVYMRDGVVVKLEGHPLAPVSRGSMCLKGLSQLHTCYSPRRVLYPIKRAGARGAENMAWERISWDEALELASTKIFECITKYGTYAFFSAVGGGGGYSFSLATGIATSLGSPTVFEPGCAQCYLPRMASASYMYGGSDQSIADCAVLEPFKGLAPKEKEKGVTQDTVAIVIWGAQPSVSQTAQSGRGMAELRACGCKTVVVDPNMSPDAVKADVWLRLRPGTSCALALSWFRYIFENKLYDEKFVKDFTNLPFIINPDTLLPFLATDVFPDYVQTAPEDTPAYVCYDNKAKAVVPFEYNDQSIDPEIFWKGEVNGKQCRSAGQIYKDAADPYTLAKTEEICWIPAAVIEKGIRVYADAPVAGIAHGVATDMEQIASQIPVGLLGLDMIMGYVNKPGATLTQNPWFAPPPGPPAPLMRPTTTAGFGGSIGYLIGATEAANEARIAAQDPNSVGIANQILIDRLGTKNHKGLYHWSHSHIPSVLEAIKTGVPFKPRVWFDFSGNKMVVLGNAGSWYDAFNEVDFCMCQYPMITSFQAEVADLIFPLGEWLEHCASANQLNYTFPQPPIIHLGETVHHAVPSQKVLNATSKKLNDYLAGGNEIVFGAVGASVGANPASPSQSSTAKDSEIQTSVNSSYYHEREKYELHFPVSFFMGGVQEDSVEREGLAARFGAPNFDTFINDVKYQQPDFNNPTDPTFVIDPKIYFTYGQHEQIATDGLPVGFATESRRCEVYCTAHIKMAATGWPYCYPRPHQAVDASIGEEFKAYDPSYEYVGTYAPICQHVEPIESPIAGSVGYDPEYPLVMTSGRLYYFHHGTMRHAPFIRELYPVPDVRMHPDTAKKYGLAHMDWVKITSRRGTTTGRAYLTRSQDPGVLWMERFWNPECFDSSQPKKTGGWRECNVNVLTKNTAPFNEVYGSYTNRGFTVKIEKGERPAGIWVEPKEFEPFLPKYANQYVPSAGSALEMPQTPPVTFNDWDRNAPAPMMGGF